MVKKRTPKPLKPGQAMILGLVSLVGGLALFLAGTLFDLVKLFGPYCGRYVYDCTTSSPNANGWPGIGLVFASIGVIWLFVGIEGGQRKRAELHLGATTTGVPPRPRIWFRMGILGAIFLGLAGIGVVLAHTLVLGVIIIGVLFAIPFFVHELERIGSIGMFLFGLVFLGSGIIGSSQGDERGIGVAVFGAILSIPLIVRELRWAEKRIEDVPIGGKPVPRGKVAHCPKCDKLVDSREITKFDTTFRGKMREGTVFRLCRDCLFDELRKSLSLPNLKAVVVQPMKDRDPLHVNAYHFYSLDEMGHMNWSDKFVDGIRSLLPGNITCLACGRNNARFSWCSPEIYFKDYTSITLNTPGKFETEFLCSDCLVDKFKQKVKENSNYFDEFLPPASSEAFGTSFEV